MAADAQRTPLIITYTNTVWKYRPNTNDPVYLPADSWTGAAFDDSTWFPGKGLFGYESTATEYVQFGGLHTFINPPAGANGQGPGGPSAYFRTHFNWTGGTVGVTMNFTNTGDDGWIVYLNGVELFSFDIPATPRPMTWDINNLPNGANPLGEDVAIVTNIVPTNLRAGDNVIAVELHQQASTSSDDVFGMAMDATLPSPLTNLTPNSPSNAVVRQNAPFTLSVSATGSPAPTYQWFEDDIAIPGATSATYASTNTAAGAEIHHFYCHVDNLISSFNSRTNQVSFTVDVDPPKVVRVVASGDFLSVVVEFDEFVDPGTAGDFLNFAIIGGSMGGVGIQPFPATHIAGNGSSTILALAAPLEEGVTYTVTVDFVDDLAHNTLLHAEAPFTSWVHSDCGAIMFEVYNGTLGPTTAGIIANSTVADLTGHSSFPNNPSEVLRLTTSFNTREVYPDDTHEGYGGRLRGLFIPPVSGAWRLFIRSDDASQLFLNPSGPGASGRTLIARENGCCNAYLEPGALQTSQPQNLVAGQAYYIEALYKEGTGGDFCEVAARIEGDPTPAASLTAIPASQFGAVTLPGLAGTFTINQQPAATSALIGAAASFTVGTSTDVPLCYQWMRGGVDISGAVGQKYTLPSASDTDNGATFSVRITIPGGTTLTSASALLTVGRDTIPPVALSAAVDAAGTGLAITFDATDLDPASATTASNYRIDGVAPLSATVSGAVVTLTAAGAFVACVDHTVVITGVKDQSQNNINPNPTTLHFAAPIILVANSDTQIWRYLGGTDLGTAWSAKGFDDSTWASGPGILAWEPDNNTPAGWPIRTVIEAFTNFVDKPTYYFRTHFNLPTHPATITALQATEVVDDGLVAYINGVEVHLNRMTAPFTFTTLAGGSTEPHPVEGPFALPLVGNGLVQGDNVLAVEVHQSATTSSDIVFGLDLRALVTRCGVGLVLTPVSLTQGRVDWSDATYHVESAAAITGPWTSQPAITAGSLININSGNRFLRLVK